MAYAARTGAISYDIPNVELGHYGLEGSFDAVPKKDNLTDPALQRLTLIVRGADTSAKDLTPESRGLEAIADGFRRLYEDDYAQLAPELVVYDALHAYLQALVTGDVMPPQSEELPILTVIGLADQPAHRRAGSITVTPSARTARLRRPHCHGQCAR